MSKPFPTFPKDPEAQRHLNSLKLLADLISMRKESSEILTKTRAFLFVLGDSPYNHDYVYFRLHEGLSGDYERLKDFYNHYIHSQGQEYMLEILNKEIGDFHDYFNDFQVILHHIDTRSKNDPAYTPANVLLWGLYCSMYDRKKLKAYVDKAMSILVQIQTEQSQSANN
jgi:hypothetical protein